MTNFEDQITQFLQDKQWWMNHVWHTPSEIIPGKLYLGNWKSQYDLHAYLPTCMRVVNASKDIPNFHQSNPDIKYVRCAIDDVESEDLKSFFDPVYNFILDGIEEGPTLVHCTAGMSRSATLVCAFLMRHQGITAETALSFVQNKRAIVSPNPEFIRQLKIYETELEFLKK